MMFFPALVFLLLLTTEAVIVYDLAEVDDAVAQNRVEEHRFFDDKLLAIERSLTSLINNKTDEFQFKLGDLEQLLWRFLRTINATVCGDGDGGGGWTESVDIQSVKAGIAGALGADEERSSSRRGATQEGVRHQVAENTTAAVSHLNRETETSTDDQSTIQPSVLILHQKAAEGDEAAVIALIKPVAIDSRDANGSTALHWAAANGHVSTVLQLLKYGAEVNATDKYGYTALYRAAANGHAAVVTALIAKQISVNARGWFGCTALHRAAEHGHEETVAILLEHGASVNPICGAEQTALHLAAANGHSTVVVDLIRHGASVNAVDKYGQSALFKAVHGGSLDTVIALLGANASTQIVDKYGETALHVAAKRGRADIVSQLILHAFSECEQQYNAQQIQQRLGSDWQFQQQYQQYQQQLEAYRQQLREYEQNPLNYGYRPSPPSPVFAWNEFNSTKDIEGIGDWPNWESSAECAEYRGIVNARDSSSRTPLHAAVARNRSGVVSVLCEAKASLEDKDGLGSTALHTATARGYKDIVDILLRCGADANAVDETGSIALHIAASRGYQHIVTALLTAGANASAAGAIGSTALHGAAAGGYHDMVFAVNRNGRNALHEATVNHHKDIVIELADRLIATEPKAVNYADNDGHTALHLAAMNGHADLIEVLMLLGADPSATNKSGQTALDLAVEFHAVSSTAMLKTAPPY